MVNEHLQPTGQSDIHSSNAPTEAMDYNAINLAATNKPSKSSRQNQTNKKPSSASTTKSKSRIPTPEHAVVKDTKHHTRQMTRYALITFTILAILAAGAAIFYFTNRVEIPDFEGRPIAEARNWEISNRITFEVTSEFNLEYADGVVISQNVAPGSHLFRGGVLPITVSLGADPDELITLPNFNEMDITEVRAWRTDLRMLNVIINEEYSETVDNGSFIRQEFVDRAMTAENYRRRDGLIIVMSRGEEVVVANIPMSNFSGRLRGDVEEWARQHDIEVTFDEAISNTVPAGTVMSQSVAPRVLVARESTLLITLSLGPAVIVPDFAPMTIEEATAFPGLSVITRRRFSDSVPFGRLISQSEPPGTELIGEVSRVTVTYSLGRPFLENLITQSESVLPEIFYNFTSQGVNVTYSINRVDSWYPRGQILNMSKYSEWLDMTDHIYIWVSRGNLNPPANTNPAE
jgi:serine/threonine-protein kinase